MNNPIKIDLTCGNSNVASCGITNDLIRNLSLWQTNHQAVSDEALTELYHTLCPVTESQKQTVALADLLYKKQDYRVAFHLYMGALSSNPLSTLLLKKAYNCTFLGAFNKEYGAELLCKLSRLNTIIAASGSGDTAQDPIRVAQTTDAYQYLFNVVHAKDVATHKQIHLAGDISLDELLISVNGEKEPRLFHYSCPFETEQDRNEFLIKKKGF